MYLIMSPLNFSNKLDRSKDRAQPDNAVSLPPTAGAGGPGPALGRAGRANDCHARGRRRVAWAPGGPARGAWSPSATSRSVLAEQFNQPAPPAPSDSESRCRVSVPTAVMAHLPAFKDLAASGRVDVQVGRVSLQAPRAGAAKHQVSSIESLARPSPNLAFNACAVGVPPLCLLHLLS